MPHSTAESERRFAVMAHASALLGLVLPLGQILGPYLVYLLAPLDAHEARRHAAASFNFQLVVVVAVAVLCGAFLWLHAGWGWLTLLLPNLLGVAMALSRATRASRDEDARYPFAIRLLRP
jgi:uncharacterized Tic20 family protein